MFGDDTCDNCHDDDDKPATAEQMAAVEFEALDLKNTRLDIKRWAEESQDLGDNLRLAVAAVRLSKPEMIDAIRKMIDSEDGWSLYEKTERMFKDADDYCHALGELFASVHTRMMIAASAVVVPRAATRRPREAQS